MDKNFEKNESYFIAQINNLESTPAKACNKKARLVKGDIAFLLINQISRLPFLEITGVQCDVFRAGCPYPDGFFQTIDQKRGEIAVKVEGYLHPHAKARRECQNDVLAVWSTHFLTSLGIDPNFFLNAAVK